MMTSLALFDLFRRAHDPEDPENERRLRLQRLQRLNATPKQQLDGMQ